jgi:nucleotide-binding universal stress UspA family protein
VVEGSIFERIPEIASQEEARVVFLGTHGKVGIQKLTGSFALKVVTRIPVPTFVVQKSSFGNGYRTVVVPVSNHQQIPLKCHWANYIAGLFDAEVHLFVIEDDNPVFARIIHSATAEIESHLKRKGIRVLVSRASHQGDFAGQLLGYAQSIRAELIQIITDAVAPNSEYVLGPWDEKILFNRVHIPVMCINPIPL